VLIATPLLHFIRVQTIFECYFLVALEIAV